MTNFGLSNITSLFGMGNTGSTSSLYSQLAQYSSIKSGAYAKLTKAYYGKNTDTSKKTESTAKKSDVTDKLYTSKAADSVKALNAVETEANELVKSAKKLVDSGKDSLFTSEKEYDKDKAYEAVSKFVTDYNDTIDKLAGTSDTTVHNNASSMKRMTDIMKNSLSKAGISIGDDGKLSVSEEDFKKADFSKIKSVFSGKNSYADIISNSASRIASAASTAENKYGSGAYGSDGTYSSYNSYYSGLYYNGFF